MRKIILAISFLCFLGALFGQEGQDIELDLTKKNRLVRYEKTLLSARGNSETRILTTKALGVSLKNPEPFIAFSVAITGENLDLNALDIYLKTYQNGKWLDDWQILKPNADGEPSATRFVSNLLELDKNVKCVKLRILTKSNNTTVKNIKMRLYAPGDVKTGDNTPLLERGICPQPVFVKRAVWGAAFNLNDNIFSGSPSFTTVTHLIVHHSAGANTSSNWAATVASIFDYHTRTNGWADVGYNWLIAPDGTLFQGRGGGNNVVGAHMCGYNANTMGVCLLGTYTSVMPPQAALEKLAALLAWKAGDAAINPLGSAAIRSFTGFMSNISGHRDGCSPNYTECPGNMVHAWLGTLRTNVNKNVEACNTVTSTNNWFENGQVEVFPNPNNGEFELRFNLNRIPQGAIEAQIFDVVGRSLYRKPLILNSTTTQEPFSLPFAQRGTYILRLTTEGVGFSKKIIVH